MGLADWGGEGKIDLREALWQSVFDQLENEISLRVIAPGTHLTETATAQRLGVSRNPVREALRALELKGWVEFRPGQGAFVRLPESREAAELFHMRDLLEAESVRLAAERIEEETLDELDGIVAAGYEAVRREDLTQILELNDAFHNLVLSASNHVLLEELLGLLRRRVAWYFGEVALHRGPVSWREHELLAAALRDRDVEKAVAVIRHHWRATAKLYIDEQAGSGGMQIPEV